MATIGSVQDGLKKRLELEEALSQTSEIGQRSELKAKLFEQGLRWEQQDRTLIKQIIDDNRLAFLEATVKASLIAPPVNSAIEQFARVTKEFAAREIVSSGLHLSRLITNDALSAFAKTAQEQATSTLNNYSAALSGLAGGDVGMVAREFLADDTLGAKLFGMDASPRSAMDSLGEAMSFPGRTAIQELIDTQNQYLSSGISGLVGAKLDELGAKQSLANTIAGLGLADAMQSVSFQAGLFSERTAIQDLIGAQYGAIEDAKLTWQECAIDSMWSLSESLRVGWPFEPTAILDPIRDCVRSYENVIGRLFPEQDIPRDFWRSGEYIRSFSEQTAFQGIINSQNNIAEQMQRALATAGDSFRLNLPQIGVWFPKFDDWLTRINLDGVYGWLEAWSEQWTEAIRILGLDDPATEEEYGQFPPVAILEAVRVIKGELAFARACVESQMIYLLHCAKSMPAKAQRFVAKTLDNRVQERRRPGPTPLSTAERIDLVHRWKKSGKSQGLFCQLNAVSRYQLQTAVAWYRKEFGE